MDNSGHERSPKDQRNCRSSNLQPPDLGRGRQAQWSSSLPTPCCRGPTALEDEALAMWDRPHPPVDLVAIAAGLRERGPYRPYLPVPEASAAYDLSAYLGRSPTNMIP
jgi:hypothetical protein